MKRRLIFHPILFAVSPILFLFDRNIRDYPFDVLYLPLGAAAGIAAVAWAALRWVTGDWRKSGLIVSLFFLLFFSCGQLAQLLPDVGLTAGGVKLHTPAFLLAASALVFAAGAWLIARTRKDLGNVMKIANVFGVALVFVPCLEIPKFYIQNMGGPGFSVKSLDEGSAEKTTKAPGKLPNIYYIILDGYGRADNLKAIYGYDDGPFVEYLKGRGFFVAAQARSNYAHTQLSMASSFNMAQLADVAAAVGKDYKRAEPLYRMIRQSRVRRMVKSLGYRFVAFSSGYHVTDLVDADEYLLAPGQRSEFVDGILSLTPTVSDEMQIAADRRRILYPFEKIPELAKSPRPLFVYAHIMAPHAPYVFGPTGGRADVARYLKLATGNDLIRPGGITRAEAIRAYVDQTIFINSKVETLVDRLISESAAAPIIIIQGDHGADAFFNHEDGDDTYMQDRMCILNAYYLPGASGALYDTITPANSFRVVFNEYFGTHLEMLPDRSYFSTARRLYDFTDVTDRIGSEKDKAIYERLKSQDYFDNSTGEPAAGADSAAD